MAVKTRAALKTDKDTSLANNTSGAITPAVLRVEVDHLADSAMFPEDLQTISQAEAEAGTATDRRAFTSQRVRQAIASALTALRPAVSQAEAEAGTATDIRGWTAQRVRQSVVAYLTGLPAPTTIPTIPSDAFLAVIQGDGSAAQISKSNAITELGGGGGSGVTLGPLDFFIFDPFNVTTVAGSQSWQFTAIGGGGFNTNTPAVSPLTFGRGIAFDASATANSGGRVYPATGAWMLIGNGIAYSTYFTAATPASLTDRFWRIGFFDSSDVPTAVVDGAYFELNGTTLSARTRSNSTETVDATTLTLAVDTVYGFEVTVAADGSSARFRVWSGNTATAIFDETITTNIPTGAGREAAFGFLAAHTTGSAGADCAILHRGGYGTYNGLRRHFGRD